MGPALAAIGIIGGVIVFIVLLFILADSDASSDEKQAGGIICGFLLLVFLAMALVGGWLCYHNHFYNLYQDIQKLDSKIEVMEERETKLMTKLEPLVSQYATLERTLIQAVRERNLDQLWALFERYPELKASINFRKLMEQVFILRDGVVKAQIEANQLIKEYNAMNQRIPDRWFRPGDLPTHLDYVVIEK
jgi:hypothetical protein